MHLRSASANWANACLSQVATAALKADQLAITDQHADIRDGCALRQSGSSGAPAAVAGAGSAE
jgi:hypothetical protein